ncbi:MAG: hypothetical protein KI790_06830 [Cyclobacteriaceae bacterium]|nr:hypothetical protein [Cyclobacteriaceae bacterium HetDA_MAG_MS6]
MKILYLFCAIGVSAPLMAQEKPLKDFAEGIRDRKICLYASTLRMINLEKNADFNQLVNGIDKLLIYTLHSDPGERSGYQSLISSYQEEGFDEYVSLTGDSKMLMIYGKEGNKDQFVGVSNVEGYRLAFYLKGEIGWQKIPSLLQNFNNNVIFDFIQNDLSSELND